MSREEFDVAAATSVNEIAQGRERQPKAPAPEPAGSANPRRGRNAPGRPGPKNAATNATPTIDGIDERFITALDQRLEKSELEELGWKGREDLNDVLRDLRKLAAVDFQRASDLWSKYRRDDRDKPEFLDNDELAGEKRRGGPAPNAKEPDKESQFVAPESVRKRFIQADNKYYFRHDDNQLAFHDHGHKIATTHNDPVVALSMVQMAEAKGWQTIDLRGSEEFKREAWLQASIKGMTVRGYKPRDVDTEKLAELKRELGTSEPRTRNPDHNNAKRTAAASPVAAANEIVDRTAVVDEPQRSLTPQQRIVLDTVKAVWRSQGSSDKDVDTAAAATVERFQNQRVYVGKLTERGDAPFENDPNNEKSFYVKLATPKGEKVVWGVDLRRALDETGIQVGDDVVVANQGRRPVQISVKDRDAAGKVVGTSTITTNRNTWRVETLESLREEALDRVREKAAQADRAPLVQVHDRNAERAIPRPEVKIEKTRDAERSR
jgi:hypothetical protein